MDDEIECSHMKYQRAWLMAGLFLSTLALLGLEMLDTRLLSVLTWYHLSFFAVSMAMLGMSAGAVHVFLGGARFQGTNARRALATIGLLFAVAVPVSHLGNLCIPFDLEISLTAVAGIVLSTLVLALPFYLAGLLVTIALTRTGERIGLVYAIDLVGAALGSLLVIPLLSFLNITSAVFAMSGFAAAGALCFQMYAGGRIRWWGAALAVVFFAAAFFNSHTLHGFRVRYAKGAVLKEEAIAYEAWTTHSQVIAYKAHERPPFGWSGSAPDDFKIEGVEIVIDGDAFTGVTRWDGRPASLSWVPYDLTAIPYHVRPGGDAAIIGSGGGRDVLSALWGQSTSITGIEINGAILHLLRGPLRDFCNLVGRDHIVFVHDEGRSYLTRKKGTFDVVQMSLVDTWAATGAGAFTLSENGLYTREAWRVFLDALKPGGILSVSRWNPPGKPEETARLVALGTASLLDRGVTRTADHMALLSHGKISTLLVGAAPLTTEDVLKLRQAAQIYGFTLVLAPGEECEVPLLRRIVASESHETLEQATHHDLFDMRPPTDQRPYFFNNLKLGGLLPGGSSGGELWTKLRSPGNRGNMFATITLLLLGVIALALVVSVIVVPLWRAGLPRMGRWEFFESVLYFAIIGLGYMFVQIPCMQRFSVYLGHPTYAIAVILFSMILFTGIGSFCSDILRIESAPIWLGVIPGTIASLILVMTLIVQSIIDATVSYDLPVRCLVVVAMTGPLAFLLGFCFPFGMRLVGRLSDDARAWMWGMNGACGVLASVLAVALSIWAGIHTSLYVAAVLYAALVLPAFYLWRRGVRAP